MKHLNQFFYQLTGPETGRSWVFLHGLMGFGNNWRKIISQLESTERCLSYDQRGHGRSVKPLSGYRPENYAEDLYEIIKDLGWNKIVLVGHSMGGRNALNFASRFPELVSHLVIVDIGPELNPEALSYYENLLNSVPTPFANREAAKLFFQTEFIEKVKTREKPEVLAAYFYANMADNKQGLIDWRFSKSAILESVSEGHNENRWTEVQSLRVPTLWIRGQSSTDLSEEVFEKVLQSNKMIQGKTIAQAGHWVHADQPILFAQAIKDFVGDF